MNTQSRTAPADLSTNLVPGRRGRPDRADPLRKDGERAGRDMAVIRSR